MSSLTAPAQYFSLPFESLLCTCPQQSVHLLEGRDNTPHLLSPPSGVLPLAGAQWMSVSQGEPNQTPRPLCIVTSSVHIFQSILGHWGEFCNLTAGLPPRPTGLSLNAPKNDSTLQSKAAHLWWSPWTVKKSILRLCWRICHFAPESNSASWHGLICTYSTQQFMQTPGQAFLISISLRKLRPRGRQICPRSHS